MYITMENLDYVSKVDLSKCLDELDRDIMFTPLMDVAFNVVILNKEEDCERKNSSIRGFGSY